MRAQLQPSSSYDMVTKDVPPPVFTTTSSSAIVPCSNVQASPICQGGVTTPQSPSISIASLTIVAEVANETIAPEAMDGTAHCTSDSSMDDT